MDENKLAEELSKKVSKEEFTALEERLLQRIEILERKVRQLQDEEGIDQKVL